GRAYGAGGGSGTTSIGKSIASPRGGAAMASPSKIRAGLTLEEFLRLPDIDEHPCLEYIDGRIEAKVAAQKRHSVLQMRLGERLNDFAEPRRLGMVFPELRCTFAGRSIVPDLVFLLEGHIGVDDPG